MSYKIMHKTHHNLIFASGFYSLERAKQWVDKFKPQMYMDKTITKDDLVILEDKY